MEKRAPFQHPDAWDFVRKCDGVAAALGVTRAQLSGYIYTLDWPAEEPEPALGSVQSDHLDRIIAQDLIVDVGHVQAMWDIVERLLFDRGLQLVISYTVGPV